MNTKLRKKKAKHDFEKNLNGNHNKLETIWYLNQVVIQQVFLKKI